MNDFNNVNEQENCFFESVKELESVNKKIARLIVRKEELTEAIIGALEHDHEGQKSYEYGEWKIEIKTPFVYSLNKREYETGCYNIPDKYNPIKECISYSIDKRLCDQYMNEAPSDVRDALIELIDKKPGKPGVTIKARS